MEEVRQLLRKLDRRLAEGEIDEAAYDRLRGRILANLTSAERAEMGLTPTPQPVQPVQPHAGALAPGAPVSGTPFPATPGRVPLGPSGARGQGFATRVGSLSDLDLRPGAVLLDRWQVEKELGRGGFGVVLLAEDRVLRQRQAVKVLDPVMVGKEQLLERFRREVTSTRSLVHPRIVRVYDYAEDLAQGLALFSMEYIEGTSVAGLLGKARARKDVVPVPLALTILAQVLEALGAAHEQGVIHRDVTPANILLAGGAAEELLADPKGDPKVKLVDFGIAGALERSELSQKSRVLGTAAYVAPEVLDPNVEVTTAADVYGAGAVFYELLTQKVPLGRFRDPSQLREGLDPGVDRLALELLDPEPERRPKARTGSEAVVYLQGEEERQKERERQAEERVRGIAAPAALAARTVPAAPSGFSIVGPSDLWYPKVIDERQEAEAKRLGVPLVIEEVKSGIVLALVPGGTFWMGASPGDEGAFDDEKPRHEVMLRPFYVGVAPVLQEQWQRVTGANRSRYKGERQPVESVSWDDARQFVVQLDGRLRLPTEAEWEHAARGGDEGARYGALDTIAWWGGNSGAKAIDPDDVWTRQAGKDGTKYFQILEANGNRTHPVGQKEPNGFGLYDTLGNVWEWCGDWFDEGYYAKSPSQNPQGPSSGTGRVVRGGSWNYYVRDLRVSNRSRFEPTFRVVYVGFRCVRDVGSP